MRDIIINSIVASALATLALHYMVRGTLSGVTNNAPLNITLTPLGAFVGFVVVTVAYLKWRGY